MKWLTWILGVLLLVLGSLILNFGVTFVAFTLFSIILGILIYFIIRIGYSLDQYKKIFYFFTGIFAVFNVLIYIVIMQLNKRLHELAIAARDAGTGSMMGLYPSLPFWAVLISIILFLGSGLLTEYLITHFAIIKKTS